MPAVELNIARLEKLVGKKLDFKQIQYDLQWISLDVDDIDEQAGTIKIEYNPNRPDFSSPEGVARTLQGYYGIKTGLATFNVAKGTEVMHVSAKVRKVRPYVVAGIVRDIKLDDDQVRTLMNIQEQLHWVLGRDRKKVAIGIHDYDKVRGPYIYTTVKPTEIKFRPLHMEAFEMTPKDILEEHPMGVKYRKLLEGYDEYPIILDAEKKVVSMPPIINGTYTQVTEQTKNLLLDLTGTNFESVNYSLNIIASTFADMGAKLETVKVIYEDEPEKARDTPDLSPTKWEAHIDYINSYIGLNLTADQMIECFRKVRLDAHKSKKKGILDIEVPAYRTDIMHEVDFAEEVAMGYDYQNLPITIKEGGIGSYHPVDDFAYFTRGILVGAGGLEMYNFILSSKQDFEKFGLKFSETENVVLDNPVSEEYNTVRTDLLPCLMKNLQMNQSAEKPFRLFEVGDVVVMDPKEDTLTRRELHVASIVHSETSDYTEIKSILDHYCRTLGILDQIEIKPSKLPSYTPGRQGEIFFKGQKIGAIGEVHPQIILNFGLGYPTAAFEINAIPLIEIRTKTK